MEIHECKMFLVLGVLCINLIYKIEIFFWLILNVHVCYFKEKIQSSRKINAIIIKKNLAFYPTKIFFLTVYINSQIKGILAVYMYDSFFLSFLSSFLFFFSLSQIAYIIYNKQYISYLDQDHVPLVLVGLRDKLKVE